MKLKFFCFLFCFIFFFCNLSAYCWTAKIYNHSFVPEKFLAIDKYEQELFVVEIKSPPSKKMTLPCTTGENRGDKWKEGDRKTPEGIYFIEGEISKGIDADKYGSLAFTLNYPNPVDVLKGKKGYGIWIHGRGYAVSNYRTKGCVALSYYDIRKLKNMVEPGKTPVVIAERINWKKETLKEQEAQKILSLIYRWIEVWKLKEPHFFNFYGSKFYSKTDGSFKNFKRKKLRLFKTYRWIDTFVFEPKIIFGPDYAVSFFYQAYVCPGFSSFGIKRLYWMKTGKEWKIVGDEWRNIDSSYVKQIYIEKKSSSILKWLEDWRKTWRSADLNRYSLFYSKDSVQDKLSGLKNIIKHKKELWEKDPPKKILFINPKVKLISQGFLVTFLQKYESKKGYRDVGRKKLVVIPNNNTWLIKSESWIPIKSR